jgi:hypothetical protein
MRVTSALLVLALGLVGARLARQHAARTLPSETSPIPYTPAAAAAPFLVFGYREAAADLLFVRLRGYFGNYHQSRGDAIIAQAETIVALDPWFERIYEFGANAATVAHSHVDQSVILRAIALLERGSKMFPRSWSIPMLAGQMCIQDLQTDDPAQRRAWDERGVLLVESAIRKPGAPQKAATWAAHIRSRLGQQERAIQGIRELLLVSQDKDVQAALLERLATLQAADATALAAEIFEARMSFERAWKRQRPSVNASMYILLGPRITPGFDVTDLATGGSDLVGSEGFDAAYDEAPPDGGPTSATGPSSP